MSARIAKECSAIQRGTGDKLGLIIYGYSSFFAGFAVAFTFGWLMTCILLIAIPVMGTTAAIFAAMVSSTMKEQMKAYAQSAGYAEQALSAIKVVHTYGTEALEMANYNKYLENAKRVGKQQAFKKALGNSILFFIIFCFYAYTFFWGGYLRYEKVLNGDKLYTGGVVIAIMFCVVFGAFGLGGAGPH